MIAIAHLFNPPPTISTRRFLLRRTIKEHRRAEDQGIHLPVQKRLERLIGRRELLDLCVMFSNIIGGRAVRWRGDLT
jgi:hypothetical protein